MTKVIPEQSNKDAEPLLEQIAESLKIIAEKLGDISESLDYIAATRPDIGG